jgi:hypothetical protein
MLFANEIFVAAPVLLSVSQAYTASLQVLNTGTR